jgi:outer membrane protein
MRFAAALLAAVFLLGAAPRMVQAQELTLDGCIRLAKEKRASIIQARGSQSMAAAEKRAALGAFLPSIRGSYSYSKGKETAIDPANSYGTDYVTVLDTTVVGTDTAIDALSRPTTIVTSNEQDQGPSKSWSLSADLTLVSVPNWFSLAAAGASKASADLDVLASEQDLVYAVRVAYFAYLASVQNVDVQREAVKRAEEQLKLIQSRFELGSASMSDVLKQKVLFGNDRLGMLDAENGIVNAEANLAYTIGLDPRESHSFSSSYQVNEYAGTLDEAVGYGLDNNPSLLSQTKTVAAAGYSLNAAVASYLPTLSLGVDWRKFNGTQAYPTAFDYSSNTRTFGLTVGWNIFDGFAREQRVTQAKVYQNNAKAGLADLRNSTVASIKTAYLDIEKQKERRAVSQENVAAAQEDLRITQEKYNLGAATILDLLNAQVSLKEAQVALIQVDFDLNLAIAKLEQAMGKA